MSARRWIANAILTVVAVGGSVAFVALSILILMIAAQPPVGAR